MIFFVWRQKKKFKKNFMMEQSPKFDDIKLYPQIPTKYQQQQPYSPPTTNTVVQTVVHTKEIQEDPLTQGLLCCLLGVFCPWCCVGLICLCFGGCKLVEYSHKECPECTLCLKISLVFWIIVSLIIPIACFIAIIVAIIASAV